MSEALNNVILEAMAKSLMTMLDETIKLHNGKVGD